MKCVLDIECYEKQYVTCCFGCNHFDECKEKGNICKNKTCDYYGLNNDVLENLFLNGINELKNPNNSFDILNWYRNLYYKEGKNTERGAMAYTINEVFGKLKELGIDLNSLSDENKRTQGEK